MVISLLAVLLNRYCHCIVNTNIIQAVATLCNLRYKFASQIIVYFPCLNCYVSTHLTRLHYLLSLSISLVCMEVTHS